MRRRLVLGLVVAGLATGCAPTVPSPSLERTAPPTPAATASPPIAASGTAGEVLQACRSASSGGAPGGGRYLPEVGTAGGTLSIGAIADLASADPLREALGPDGLLTSLVWRRPLLETMDGGFLPDLASVPPSLDNGLVTVTPDGAMAVTWCLRDTAWSDGRAITCADYQFTLHWLDDVVPDAAARFGSPVAVDCPTPQVAIVRYPTVFEPYGLRSLPPLPRQALASVTAGDAAGGGLFSPKALIGLPVSGPFRVTALGADGTLVFTANPGYRGGLLGTATRLSQLSVSPFATLPALEAAFQAGTVQLATGISPTAITELQRLGLHDETAAAPGRSYEAIVFNLGSDACASVAAAAAGRGSGCPTADLAIRRAIDLVAARPDLVAALNRRSDRFVIEAVPSAVAPASWFFADVPTPAVDPDGARAALDAAGWRDTDGDGIREREGVEARLALCAPDDPDSAAAARLLADEVRAVGIEASLGSGSCDLTTGAFDLALATRSYAVDPADLRLRFHSQAIPPSGDNIGRVAFADIDADLQRAATSVDFAVVKDAMVSFQEAYLDHVVEIPIGAVADVELVGPAMGNYFQSWVSPGWNAQDWFVRR